MEFAFPAPRRGWTIMTAKGTIEWVCWERRFHSEIDTSVQLKFLVMSLL